MSRDEYEQQDSKEFPAYLFCISDIVSTYGQCPHLSLDQIPLRDPWLKATHDGGKIYTDLRDRIDTQVKLKDIQKSLCDHEKELETYIRTQLDELGFQSPKPELHALEYIVESIRSYQQVKNRTNLARTEWKQVQKFVDDVFEKSGINFVKYLKLAHNITFRYRHSDNATVTNTHYDQLCDQVLKQQRSLLNEETFIRKKKDEGVNFLGQLIDNQFNVEQAGKYFKRWTLLTKDQQKERLQTYLEWFLRVNAQLSTHDAAVLVDRTVDHIMTAVASGELKSSGIKWVTKGGIVMAVDGLTFDPENQEFKLDTSTTKVSRKRVTFAGEETETTSTTTVRPSRSRKKPSFTLEEQGRLNKLLLYQLLELSEVGQSKESIVHAVANSFTSHPSVKQKAISYTESVLPKMVAQVQETLNSGAFDATR